MMPNGKKNIDSLPYVCIVVPVYNGERTIRRALDALLTQDYPKDKYEIVVVDNKSTDSTPQIVASYARVKLLHQTAVQSSYAARNLGISHARGEMIAFTDVDCVPEPTWLSKLIFPFSDPRVMAVGGMVLDTQGANLVEKFQKEISLFSNYYKTPEQFLKPLITANVAFRKNILDEINCFNANLYTGSDIDLAWRLQLKNGDCVRYIQDAVVYHQHRSSLKGLYRQYLRHGFGEILLDAMYHHYPGYPRPLRFQIRRIGQQVWALMTYLRSFVFRLLKYPFHRDRYYLLKPLFWFVAESGNVWGKLQGLWATRGLRLNPTLRQWQDPGG